MKYQRNPVTAIRLENRRRVKRGLPVIDIEEELRERLQDLQERFDSHMRHCNQIAEHNFREKKIVHFEISPHGLMVALRGDGTLWQISPDGTGWREINTDIEPNA